MGFFCSNLVPTRTNQVRTVYPIETTAASGALGMWVAAGSDKVRKIDQNATFGAPLLKGFNLEESLRKPLSRLRGKWTVGSQGQARPWDGGLTVWAQEQDAIPSRTF